VKLSEIGGKESKYLKATDLPVGKEVLCQIRAIQQESLPSYDNPDEQVAKWCLYFEKREKGLVLNLTNTETLMNGFGDCELDDLVGREIYIYRTTTKVRGEEVACIRLRCNLPPAGEDEIPF
jgi:hypothetical protein